MKIALSERGLNLLSEEKVEVRFRKKPIGHYFADLIIENSVVVEIKSTARLAPEHSAQTINYLKAGSLKTALLINFGTAKLQIKRLHG